MIVSTPSAPLLRPNRWLTLLAVCGLGMLALSLVSSRALAQYYNEPHAFHEFGQQETNLDPPGIAFEKTTAAPGEIITLNSYSFGPDVDYCTSQQG